MRMHVGVWNGIVAAVKRLRKMKSYVSFSVLLKEHGDVPGYLQ